MDETSSVPPTPVPQAGWYPDPLDGAQDRWWTGQGWSEHTQQRVTVPPPAYPPPAYAAPAYPQPTYAEPAGYTPMAYSAPQYTYTPIDPLSEPLPGASIGQAFVRFWTKYAVFSGRASRSEYWWWVLTFSVTYAAILILEAVLDKGSIGYLAVSILFLVWALANIVPSWALLFRRLHDANLSGWNYFWSWIPLVGGIVLLVFLVRPSDPAGRRFDAY